jgi:GTP-binding protein
MVDGVLLLVDAVDGPMPQTRFVTQKAFLRGFTPLVVINKIDRDGARPGWVLDQTFDLFDRLGASDKQLDFPVIYASALRGYAGDTADIRDGDMQPLFEAIVKNVPPPPVETDGPLQLQVSSLDYSSYVGLLGIGRVSRGVVKRNMPVTLVQRDGTERNANLMELYGFDGLERKPVTEAGAGDIVVFSGIDDLKISDTVCARGQGAGLPPLQVDEPTITMTFQVNKSPFAGKEGKYLTSRQIKARLEQELTHNVALRVEPMDDPDKFRVSGRGELHLSVLIENMRREGYELAVSRPAVIEREVDGVTQEPWEQLTVDFAEQYQGAVMTRLAERKGELLTMMPDGRGRVRLEYRIPARGLIGFQGEFMTLTRGTGLMSHVFDDYAAEKPGGVGERRNGVLISQDDGDAVAYALWKLQERGRMFVSPGDKLYEGMIIGIHSRDNDLVVNPIKGKQLTNVRASGKDEHIDLVPPIRLTLEYAVEFIADDELVEVTPQCIRLRKRHLKEHERKREQRKAADG